MIFRFFCQLKIDFSFEIKYKNGENSIQIILFQGCFFAIKIDTFAVQHHISKKVSQDFRFAIFEILSKSFVFVGTKGASEKNEKNQRKDKMIMSENISMFLSLGFIINESIRKDIFLQILKKDYNQREF